MEVVKLVVMCERLGCFNTLSAWRIWQSQLAPVCVWAGNLADSVGELGLDGAFEAGGTPF